MYIKITDNQYIIQILAVAGARISLVIYRKMGIDGKRLPANIFL